MVEGMNGKTQVQPGSVAGTSVPQPPSLEGPPVHPIEFSFRQLDADRQQIQSQMKNLQEQQKELVDGQKVILPFFEKLPEVRQSEMTRDPITTIPIIVRGNRDILNGVQIPGSSHQSAFFRLGKQVLLDNQTEGVNPEGIVAAASRPTASQVALSSASVTKTSRRRCPRISPERRHQVWLEERLGRNHKFSPDPPARRPTRLPAPIRHREEGIENRPANPRQVEVPVPVGRLPRLDLTEETLLDRIEERLQLRKRG